MSTPGSRDPRPVAIGRLALAQGWAGLAAVWTDPAMRGRGLATRVTTALAVRARADGIRLVHLQVEADNATAIRLYERLGFERHSVRLPHGPAALSEGYFASGCVQVTSSSGL